MSSSKSQDFGKLLMALPTVEEGLERIPGENSPVPDRDTLKVYRFQLTNLGWVCGSLFLHSDDTATFAVMALITGSRVDYKSLAQRFDGSPLSFINAHQLLRGENVIEKISLGPNSHEIACRMLGRYYDWYFQNILSENNHQPTGLTAALSKRKINALLDHLTQNN